MKLIPATAAETPAMAAVHAQAFDSPWTEENFEDLLDGAGIFGFLAADEDPMGVILCRVAASEVEVLTVGVAPWARRRGIGEALLRTALAMARQAGAAEAFLEVDVDNTAAVTLYERLGFARAGLRKAYYDRGAAGRADALVLRLDLTARDN
jgi:ribosomal-protein-alanine N-acetyltransferase